LVVVTSNQGFFHPRKGGEKLGQSAFSRALVANKNRHPLEIQPAIVTLHTLHDGAEVFDAKSCHVVLSDALIAIFLQLPAEGLV
jgi:hypothetical protein